MQTHTRTHTHLLGQSDIGAALLGVVHGRGQVHNLRAGARQVADGLGKLLDAVLVRVANVDRVRVVAARILQTSKGQQHGNE